MLYKAKISRANSNVCGRTLTDLLLEIKHLDPDNVINTRNYFEKFSETRSSSQIFGQLKGKYMVAPYEGVFKIKDVSYDIDRVHCINMVTGDTANFRMPNSDNYFLATTALARKLLTDYRKLVMAEVRKYEKQLQDNSNDYLRSKYLMRGSRIIVGKSLAIEIHKIVKHDDYETDVPMLRDLLNSRYLSSETRTRIFNVLTSHKDDLTDHLFVCPDCGEIEWLESAGRTIYDNDVCESCLENYYYSSYHGEYIHQDDARPYYESTRSYHNEDADDWYNINYDYEATYHDGAYFDYDTYDALFSDDEEDDDDDGLAGYHSSYRNFVEKASDKRYVPLGVELEVYAENRYDVVHSMRDDDAFSDTYLERDGSLSEYHGFEIITQPLGKTEWDSFAPKLLNHLLDRKVLGYNHPDSNSYGIHISINRAYLSPLQEARMSLFLTAEENIGFVKAIAQRNAIYGGSDTTQIGSLDRDNQTIRNMGGLRTISTRKKKIYGMGKYSPLNLKPDVAECRIFQSTLHPQSFMKNLEFVWALVEWTNVTSATGSSWLHTDFVKWLAARPNADTDFGNLIAYLRRPKYVVKRGSGAITNTWLGLLPHITTKSQPVEDIEEEALAA